MGLRVRCSIVAAIVLLPALTSAQPPSAASFRDAALRGLAAIQAAQKRSRATQTCTGTCHLQVYGAFAYRAAREHGIPIDEAVARADATRAFRGDMINFAAAVENNSQGEVAMNQAFALVAAHQLGLRPSAVTAALARAVALKQNPDGDWTALQERPPSNHSSFTFTALGLRALQLYGHPLQKSDAANRVARAKQWLQGHGPLDTEGKSYQLLGLSWAGADRSELARLARALADAQRADGGWNALEGRDSDVYSTAQALVALHDAGAMSTSDPVWRRGAEFLLRAQAADGTWHVRTRLPPWVSPPYFESGYPYGRDQFISVAAANWSVRALALGAGESGTPVPQALPLADVEPPAVEPWVETALFGTTAELKHLLDDGLNPNIRTIVGGIPVLTLAASDSDKVHLLLDRGADVNARSPRHYSALLVATQYREATPAIRLLLARGAQIEGPPDAPRPAGGVYPTFFAAHAGNAEILPDLRREGDRIDDSALMFAGEPVSSLGVAALYDHVEAARTLIRLGAKVDPVDARTGSPLVSAVLANHVEFARLLLASGANVNRVDENGMTPLMYAAVADFGDTGMINLLLKSGARTDLRDKSGFTAADHARAYKHPEGMTKIVSLLRR